MINLSKRRWAPLGLLMAAVAAPMLSIAGCGGGGNAIPSPTTSGTPTPSQNFTPNYVASIENRLRWASFPINVYFVPNSEFNAARRNIAITGFNQWVSATGNRVPYQVVTDANQADISVTFSSFSGGPGDELGLSTITFEQSTNLIIEVAMNIGITGDSREDIQTAAHEFGHSLGIAGHSPNEADLMFPVGNSAGCSCITTADLNTLLAIYNGQFNTSTSRSARTRPTGPTRTITIH